MYVQDLIEVLCAAHLSCHVEAPFHERGGIILVGPPGGLKSTLVEALDKQYSDALTLSDLNAKSLAVLRGQLATGVIRTLVFPELAKLYERADSTAENLEGVMRALVAEGFSAASFEDQRVNRAKARAMVIAAVTPTTQERRFTAWEESGFNRRFLWSLYTLDKPEMLEQAVLQWRRLRFRTDMVPRPPLLGETIPNDTTAEERQALRVLIKYQPGGSHVQQLQLLIKILAVLKWWYAEMGVRRDPMQVLQRFGVSLGRNGARLDLKESLREQGKRKSPAKHR